MSTDNPPTGETGTEPGAAGTHEIVAVPAIIDAVVDQEGDHWIRYGTEACAYWFTLRELVSDEKAVLARLAGTGKGILTTASKNAFKKEVERHKGYREALVAARPGWLGSPAVYVWGNGDVERPAGDTREVIITFERNPKFDPVGTEQAWRAGLGPFVKNQPIPLALIAYGFVGPILRFAPPHLQNPHVEIVGDRELAKTTWLVTVMAIFAGNPASDVGGAETWDATINSHDLDKHAHADSLLARDEVNLAGTNTKDQGEVVRKAAFKGATTGSRKRLTDLGPTSNVRLAMLSTSNVPQRDLVRGHAAEVDAVASRIVTIAVPKGHPHGVFGSVPVGYADAREAAEALRGAADRNYGVAGRTFVRWLVAEAARDEAGLRGRIEALMNRFLAAVREGGSATGGARCEKTLAAAYAAGELAGEAGVTRRDWGDPLPALLGVCHVPAAAAEDAESAPAETSAYEQVRAYRARHRRDIARAKRLRRPYDEAAFARKAGVLRRVGDRMELLIPAERFRAEFPNHRALINQLKAEGRARTEGGRQPKHTIKVPGRICRATPRVYCVTVVDDVGPRRSSGM